MKPRPHNPEPLPRLRMRFQWAIDHELDPAGVDRGEQPTPWSEPHHTFDLDGGLRLIVFRSIGRDGVRGTQVEALCPPGGSLRGDLLSGATDARMLVEIAVASYRALSRDTRPIHFHGFIGPCSTPTWTIAELSPVKGGVS